MKKILSLFVLFGILFSNIVPSFANTNTEFYERNKEHMLGILDDIFADGTVYDDGLDITEKFIDEYLEMYNEGEYDELASILAYKDYSYCYGVQEIESPHTRAEGGSFQKIIKKNYSNQFWNYGRITYQSRDVYTMANSNNQVTGYKNYIFLVTNSTGQPSSNLAYIRMLYYPLNWSSVSPRTGVQISGTIRLKVGSSYVYLYEGRDSGTGLLPQFATSMVSYAPSSSLKLPSKDSAYIRLTSI